MCPIQKSGALRCLGVPGGESTSTTCAVVKATRKARGEDREETMKMLIPRELLAMTLCYALKREVAAWD